MNARKAIDGKALIYMIGLCAIWGMQQTAVKLAAPAMPEILQVALRSGVALVVIAGIAAEGVRPAGSSREPGKLAWS